MKPTYPLAAAILPPQLLILLMLLVTGFSCKTIRADESLADRIDPLFARYSTNTPGFAVGVIRDGKLVFAKGYGMANLEYGVPITPRSPFYIASMSKQFTAACAALLIQQGKIHLDDPVGKYLPELPDYHYPTPLTINHLIHHTGGVREWSSLVLFAGQDTRYEQHFDNPAILRLLLAQKTLEFEPGTQYRYSSGGYVLLAEIIRRVTGQALPAFARQNLFQPLGMDHTFFEDNYAAILPGRVESYRSVDHGRYERILKHFDLYGDGGLITTIEDLVRWDANFTDNKLGGKAFLDLMHTQGRLASGEELDYAFGLEIYQHNGHKVVEHGGGMLGFTVDMMRFPDDHLTVIALANNSDRWSTQMAFQVADLFLAKSDAPAHKQTTAPSSSSLASEQLKQFLGCYWRREANSYRRVVINNHQLVLDWGEGTGGQRLAPLAEHQFLLDDGSDTPTRVVFIETPGGGMRMNVGNPKRMDGYVADRYDPTPPVSLGELQAFVGDYRSDELGVVYTFSIDDGRFILRMAGGEPITLFPKSDSHAVWNSGKMVWIRFGEIIFQQDSGGEITGLTIGDQRVSAVQLVKIR